MRLTPQHGARRRPLRGFGQGGTLTDYGRSVHTDGEAAAEAAAEAAGESAGAPRGSGALAQSSVVSTAKRSYSLVRVRRKRISSPGLRRTTVTRRSAASR